jgi:hypothetical protein
MLADLAAAWERYYPVYRTHKTRPTIALKAYLGKAVELWQNGSGTKVKLMDWGVWVSTKCSTIIVNRNISWPDLLRIKSWCAKCGMEYSIDIRNKRFGLPYRQYIWKGGKNPVDMPILDSNYNPEKEMDGTPDKIHPYAGKDWCFAYGEREWRNPSFTVPNPSNPANRIPASFSYFRDRADNNAAFRTNCN